MEHGKYLCISQIIIKRKWTRKLIEDFLGEPDTAIPNKNYPNSHLIKLYDISRVQRIERNELFVDRMSKINQHREIMKSYRNNEKGLRNEY